MNTARKIIPLQGDHMLLRQLHEQIARIEILLDKNIRKPLPIPSNQGIRLVKQNQILRCESSGNYTCVFLISGEKLCVSKTLKWVSERLSSIDFYRIHNSHLVSINQISLYHRTGSSSITLIDGNQLPVSRNRKHQLDQLLK